MQVNNTNIKVSQKTTEKNINNKGRNTSFKGVPVALDKFALGTANCIENGGLAVSFTLQDMLGTNLPRPIMGLSRNKKENKGENNTKFALKELVREMLTGPSMFIIPGILFSAGKKAIGSAINVPVNFINSLGDIHAANPLKDGKAIGKEDFYKNAFTEIIKNAKSESQASKETLQTAEDFAKRLYQSVEKSKTKKTFAETVKNTAHNLLRGEQNETINKLSDEFIEISKKHAKDAVHTDFTQASVSSSASAPFKKAVENIIAYADDAVVKAGKNRPENITSAYVKKLANKKVLTRFAANVGIYAAILAFLQVIPRLYNKAEGEKNAGLKGLMKEETLNDKSLDDNTAKKGNAQNTGENETKDKSNPSFGSSAGFVNQIAGKGIIGKIAHGLEFDGCNVSFPMLLGIMGFGIILPRTQQAKDKYDRQEILRRDTITCATMCFAEKELRKGFSKYNENKSGLVLAAKEAGFKDKNIGSRLFDYLRPEKGVRVLSSEQIVSKYSGIDKYKDGIKGFCEFIDGQGGKLNKVFSLTDDSKNIVDNLLKKEGKNLAEADNKTIIETLSNAIDSDDVKQLTDLFKNKDNPWVTKAKTLNARFTALSVLVLVPLFLGILLPKINEIATKKRIKKEDENSINSQMNNSTYILQNNNKVFEDIINFKK